MEKYQRLFQLPENLYVPGSPVVISAGAITKDTETGAVFAQIKTKNISRKIIKAVIVELTGFDVQKNEVDEKITYEYLDLNCGFNCEVGSKTPIFLKNKGTRSFSINNIRVVFEDDSFFTTDFSNAESIPGQKKLSAVYDEDQSAQFKKEFGNKSKFSARNYKDLFLCSCGAINKTPTCLACRANIETMISADPETLKKDGVYNKAVSRMNAADYETASQLFNSVIEWRDSRDLLEKCIVKKTELQVRKEQEKKRNKKLILAVSLIAAVAVVFSVVLSVVVMPSANYKKALAATDAGNYSEAYSRFFEYPDYKDTKEQIASAKEKQAEEFFQSGDYENAYSIFSGIGKRAVCFNRILKTAEDRLHKDDYNSVKEICELNEQFSDAVSDKVNEYVEKLCEEKDYVKAREVVSEFKDIISENDLEEYISEKELVDVISKLNVGDVFKFGRYEQDNNLSNGEEEIEWIVLKKSKSDLLVISKYVLEFRKYSAPPAPEGWETSNLRNWMHTIFYQNAFNENEKRYINCVKNTKDSNDKNNVNYGRSTADYCFTLTLSEVEKYLPLNERICYPTPYAVSNSTWYTSSSYPCYWWIRTPVGYVVDQYGTHCIGGLYYKNGMYYTNEEDGVRPAMYINTEGKIKSRSNYYYINTEESDLRVRKEKDITSEIIEKIPKNALVYISEYGNDWSKITYKNKTGYVKSEYLQNAR